MEKRNLFLAGILCLVTLYAQALTYYVDISATGNNDGTSWANAYTDLQAALGSAGSGDDIRVAEGVYKPTSGTNRAISFLLIPEVEMYGGYPSGGGTTADPHLYLTYLSGEINTGAVTDNTYNVVELARDFTGSTLMDGFIIEDGYADGALLHEKRGGGLYYANASSGILIVSRCVFQNNHADVFGGALQSSDGNIDILNCLFTTNDAGHGGAVGGYQSTMMFRETEFTSNSATGNGGVMHLYEDCSVTLSLCTATYNASVTAGGVISNRLNNRVYIGNFVAHDNYAGTRGGLFYANSDNTHFYMANVLATCNIADVSGNIYHSAATGSGPDLEVYFGTFTDNSGSAATTPNLFSGITTSTPAANYGWISNCIFWQNEAVTFAASNFQFSYTDNDGSGGTNNVGNINTNPRFISPNGTDAIPCTFDENMRPNGPGTAGTDSPCLNAGSSIGSYFPLDFADVDNNGLGGALPLDLDLNNRVSGSDPDMGAYENDGSYKRGDDPKITRNEMVFPNPAVDEFTVAINAPIKQVRLYDMKGQLQSVTINIIGATATLNVVNLTPGIYFLKVNDYTAEYCYKLEKM